MQRRFALAISLALTTVVGFAVVAFGAQAGLFGSVGHKRAAEAVAQPTAVATQAQAAPAPAPTPVVITEYIQVPAPAGASVPAVSSAAAPASQQPATAPVSHDDGRPAAAAPAPSYGDDGEGHDD